MTRGGIGGAREACQVAPPSKLSPKKLACPLPAVIASHCFRYFLDVVVVYLTTVCSMDIVMHA
jgi:hypothetical protein